MSILGIHHVTLICASAQRTLLFYTGVLGMRLIKQTVSIDDPGIYHIYLSSDGSAEPGRVIAFLEWPKVPCGTRGIGGIRRLGLAAPVDALGAWEERLRSFGVDTQRREGALVFRDPDGMELAITAEDAPALTEGLVCRLNQITALCSGMDATAQFLGDVLGLRRAQAAEEGARSFVGGQGGPLLTYVEDSACATPRAQAGTGQPHHITMAVCGESDLLEWRERLIRAGLHASPIIDRVYFKSLYTHDPDGLVIELATTRPGFTIDEPLERLGRALQLPPWLEPHRSTIERVLPPLYLPC